LPRSFEQCLDAATLIADYERILLFFAFVGFERPTAVAGEVIDARRAVPFALIAGMVVVTALYAGVIAACWRGVPDLATSARPVVDLLARLYGSRVARVAEIAAAVIVLGTLVSQWITAPRLILALSERAQVPAVFGRLAPRRRTPDIAILTTGLVAIALALSGDFVATIAASSASRLLIFMGCAGALLRLRRQRGAPDARFRLPLGTGIATCVILACGALLVAASAELARLGVLIVVGGLLWLISNGKRWSRRTR
jgi:amino acid transporter